MKKTVCSGSERAPLYGAERGASALGYVGMFLVAALIIAGLVVLVPGVGARVGGVLAAAVCKVVNVGSPGQCDVKAAGGDVVGSDGVDRSWIGKIQDFFAPPSTDDISPEDVEAINEQDNGRDLLSAGGDVKQGSIGDCYWLAGVISLSDSEEGSKILRDMVEPRYSEKIRWSVNPFSLFGVLDEREKVHDGWVVAWKDGSKSAVKDVYSGAALQDGDVSLVSVVERAYGEKISWHDLNDGGSVEEAFEVLTGNDAKRLDSKASSRDSYGFSREQKQAVIDALSKDQPVGTGTSGSDPNVFRYGEEARYSSVAATDRGGESVSVMLPYGHAYSVVDADADTVTIINPWGYNRASDTKKSVSAEVTLAWEDADRVLGHVDIGQY